MLFPPAADPRLKEEIFSLLRLAKKLEMNAIDHTPRSDYRARIGEKLGIEIPD
jgi:predicted metal-dependent TIM-barrel fold hydrolase